MSLSGLSSSTWFAMLKAQSLREQTINHSSNTVSDFSQSDLELPRMSLEEYTRFLRLRKRNLKSRRLNSKSNEEDNKQNNPCSSQYNIFITYLK